MVQKLHSRLTQALFKKDARVILAWRSQFVHYVTKRDLGDVRFVYLTYIAPWLTLWIPDFFQRNSILFNQMKILLKI